MSSSPAGERSHAGAEGRVAWVLLLAAGLALGGSILVAKATGIPRPGVADEFCYLLSGDTFARGRLTNPTHEHWHHFEAFHIIHEPTYSAKYPPGQGLMLALGQRLGHPVVGVWLNSALMAAAITWMLLGWLPRRWALFGGLLTVLLFGVSGVWAQSYMAASLVATGGALVYGGLRRLIRSPTVAASCWMAVGLLVLANTRPFEGLITSLPAAGVILVWLARRRGDELRMALRRVVAPVLVILALGAGWTLSHNRAVTGSVLTMPYQVHQQTYPFVSLFIWEKVPTRVPYRHHYFRAFERRVRTSLMPYNPPGFRWKTNIRRLRLFREQYFPGWTWTVLLLLPLALRSRWTLLALGSCLVLLAVQLLSVSVLPHYSSPIAALLVLLIVQSVRALERLPRGPTLARVFALLLLLLTAASTLDAARRDNSNSWKRIHSWRPVLEQELEQQGGRHLILVRYGPRHNPHEDWVYNSGEIDGQDVVWAHSMGGWHDRQLLHYFRDRTFWQVDLGFGEDPWARPPFGPYRRPGLLETAAATKSSDLHLALERLRKRNEPEVRRGLAQAIDGEVLEGKTAKGSAGAQVVGAGIENWTHGKHPAAVLVRNTGEQAAIPRLTLACQATGDDLPVRVSVEDGRRQFKAVFKRGGRRWVELDPLAPGDELVVLVAANRAWPAPSGSRILGVKIDRVDLRPAEPTKP